MGGWSPDGRRIPVAVRLAPKPGKPSAQYRTYLFDVVSGKSTPAPLPNGHNIVDWSKDGKTLLTLGGDAPDGSGSIRLALMPVAGGKPTFLTPESVMPRWGRLSPDGTRLLYTASSQDPQEPDRNEYVYIMGLKERKPIRVSDPSKGYAGLGCCWSPDGKRIAYVRVKPFVFTGEETAYNFAVVVANADGSQPRTVIARSGVGKDAARVIKLALCDWH
jgi:Tol biopolymer transport system component